MWFKQKMDHSLLVLRKSGVLKSCGVGHVIQSYYDYPKYVNGRVNYSAPVLRRLRETEAYKKIFNKNDTYAIIFNIDQKDDLDFFLTLPQYKVIFKSPQACNTTPGHGTAPRNTLVIFELKDVDENPAVPKVSESRK
jgi:hypothetical protein